MEAEGDNTDTSLGELGIATSNTLFNLSQKEWVGVVSSCLLVVIAAIVLWARRTGGRRLDEKLSKEQEEVLRRLLEKKGDKAGQVSTNVSECITQYLQMHIGELPQAIDSTRRLPGCIVSIYGTGFDHRVDVCPKQTAQRPNTKREEDGSVHKGTESSACDSSCSPLRGSDGCSEGQGAFRKAERESPPHVSQSAAATQKNTARADQGKKGRKLGLAPPYTPARDGERTGKKEGRPGSSAAEPEASMTGDTNPTRPACKKGSVVRGELPAGNLWSAGPVETRARYPFLSEWQREMQQALGALLNSEQGKGGRVGKCEGKGEPAAGADAREGGGTGPIEEEGEGDEGQGPHTPPDSQTPQDTQAAQDKKGWYDERSGVFTISRPAPSQGPSAGPEKTGAVLSVARQASLLSVLLGNILRNPHEPKLRIFRPSQSTAFAALWQGCPLSRDLLKKLGFVEVKSRRKGTPGDEGRREGKGEGTAIREAESAGNPQIEMERGAMGEEGKGEGQEGSLVVLWKVSEAHLEVMRGLVDRLDEHLQPQAQAPSPSVEASRSPLLGTGGANQWDGEMVCQACGREDLFVDAEHNRPTVLFRARHPRVAVRCTACPLLVCGDCYNLNSTGLPHDPTHVMVAMQGGGEEGGGQGKGWKKTPPPPRDRKPGRGPWG